MTKGFRLAGSLLCLLLWLPPMGRAVAQEANSLSAVEISPYLVSPTTQTVRGEVLLRSLEEEAPVRRLPLGAVAPLSLRLPAGSIWEVSGEISGFWVRRKTLTVGSSNQPTRLPLGLWPMGSITGSVKIKDQRSARPDHLRVQTLEPPSFLGRPPVPPGVLDCPVDEKGSWTCSLPAATFDLVISAQGLTPVYRWAVEVPAGKTFSLGTVELEQGSSVAGWVAVEGGTIEAERCAVRLTPLLSTGADLRKSVDLERTAIEHPVRRDGFFQLTGLSAGMYALEVRQPGYAPARLSPIRIEPAAETFLRDPLVLTRPLDLVFQIDPPLDWLGKSWRARVIRHSEARLDPVVFEGAADKEGHFAVPGQASGRYRISVFDSLGNAVHYRDDLEISSSAEGAQRIELDLVDLEGRVRLGQEPLPGTLWFGGKNAAVSMKIETDTEGRFFGVLPREGFWIVEVEATDPNLRSLTRVEVRASDSGKAKLQIDLPDTRLFGRVLDEEGRPVPRADVFAESDEPPQRIQTDDAGAFELRGLPEGFLRLGAATRSHVSDFVFTALAEGRAVGPLDLRLRRMERLEGWVSTAQGPLAGAQVAIFPSSLTGGLDADTTGTDGAFTVDLPSGFRQVVAVVMAPGFAFKALGPLTPDDLRLSVSGEEGGALELIIPAHPDEVIPKNLSFVVFAGGSMIPFGLIDQWARSHGEAWVEGKSTTLRIPHMAPGEYRFCLIPRVAELTFTGTLPDVDAACDSGRLSPGATLSLEPAL